MNLDGAKTSLGYYEMFIGRRPYLAVATFSSATAKVERSRVTSRF